MEEFDDEKLNNAPESIKWMSRLMKLQYLQDSNDLLRWHCNYNQVDDFIIEMIKQQDPSMDIMAIEMLYNKYGKS